MKKGLISIILCFTLLVGGLLTPATNTAGAASNGIKISLNGVNKQITGQKPEVKKGTTMVPVRFISENLGAKVNWNAKTKTVTITKGSTTMTLTIGSKTAKVKTKTSTKKIILSYAPYITNNTTMVPVRFIGEAFGATVEWQNGIQLVLIDESRHKSAKKPRYLTNSNAKKQSVYYEEMGNNSYYYILMDTKQTEVYIHLGSFKDYYAWYTSNVRFGAKAGSDWKKIIENNFDAITSLVSVGIDWVRFSKNGTLNLATFKKDSGVTELWAGDQILAIDN